jgi:hypothetical protein
MLGKKKKVQDPSVGGSQAKVRMRVMPAQFLPKDIPAASAQGSGFSLKVLIPLLVLVLVFSIVVVVYAFREQLFSPTQVSVVNVPANETQVNAPAVVANVAPINEAVDQLTLTNRSMNDNAATVNVGVNIGATTNTVTSIVNAQNDNNNIAPIAPPSGASATEEALARDVDGDSLTAAEEQLWGTNPTFADTDGDGFFDGQEILGGFSPLRQNERLAVGTEISVQSIPEQGYTITYPIGLLFRRVDDAGAGVILTTSTGEYFEITAQANAAGLTAAQWYQRIDPTVNLTQMRRIRLSGVEAVVSKDGRAVYVPHAGKMITLVYVLGNRTSELYKTTFTFIYSSLVLNQPTDGQATSTGADAPDVTGDMSSSPNL